MPRVVFNLAYTTKSPPRNIKSKDKAAYIARRSFYNMTADYNYFTYILNQEKVAKNKDVMCYYTQNDDEAPIFNLRGIMPQEHKEEIERQIKKTSSIIWHGVISFDEETSKGFVSQEKAQLFFKKTFNAFLERTHLKKENLEIIASLHNDTENSHIHFSFFEKEPKRRNAKGELCYSSRGTVSISAIENYLISANMHMSEHKDDYYSARDRAMSKLNELRANRLKHSSFELRYKVERLAEKIPADNRVQYGSKNMEFLRKQIDEVAELLIKSSGLALKYHKETLAIISQREAEARKICTDEVHKQFVYCNRADLESKELHQLIKEGKTEYIRANRIKWENIDLFERLRQDYKTRIGNVVLGLCKDLKRDFQEKKIAAFNDRQKKIASRKERRRRNNVMNNFMMSIATYQRSLKADFTKSLKQIEQELESEQYMQGENIG